MPEPIPFGVFNNIRREDVAAFFDPKRDSLFGIVQAVTENAYKSNVIKNTGPYVGQVLRVEVGVSNTKGSETNSVEPNSFLGAIKRVVENNTNAQDVLPVDPVIIQIKARIPEIHTYLPIPEKFGDEEGSHNQIIDLYPTFISQNTNYEPKVGDLVWLDYTNKVNWQDPIYLGPVDSKEINPSQAPGSGGNGAQDSFANTAGCGNNFTIDQKKVLAGAANIDLSHIGLPPILKEKIGMALLFGDSQMAGGGIGLALKAYLKSNGWTNIVNEAIGGSSVDAWVGKNFNKIESKLPDAKLIFISLGGNGATEGSVRALLAKIRAKNNSALIIWSGPPPAVRISSKNVDAALKVFGNVEKGKEMSKKGEDPRDYYLIHPDGKKSREVRVQRSQLIGNILSQQSNVVFLDLINLMPGLGYKETKDGIHTEFNNGGPQYLKILLSALGAEQKDVVAAATPTATAPTPTAPTTVTPIAPSTAPTVTTVGDCNQSNTADLGGSVAYPDGTTKYFVPVVEDAIIKAAKKHLPSGLELNIFVQWIRTMCNIESGGVINAINSFGYTGLFQFGAAAWKAHGEGPFIKDLNNVLDPYKNASAGASFMASNYKLLKSKGIVAKGEYLYMMHQQGPGGFLSLYNKATKGLPWNETSGKGGKDWRNAQANGCKGKTSEQCNPKFWFNMWVGKWNNHVKIVSQTGRKGGISYNLVYIKRMAKAPPSKEQLPEGWV